MIDDGSAPPTVVLVHGAFADGGSWARVAALLVAQGIGVLVPAVPLRGIASDSAYLASVLSNIHGPVLAVGHSYGGAVITNAASRAPNVIGLVYVAGFAPDEGESIRDVEAMSRDSAVGPALLRRGHLTGCGEGTDVELFVEPTSFHRLFAADLTPAHAAVLAASQRPLAESAVAEKARTAAWRTLPSWAVVATADRLAGTDVIRSMARRAGAEIVELEGSHAIMISQPRRVAEVILAAVKSVTP
ncbi:alpha/beta fold hydrolase [Herbiconiux daphne]|uniref:Alpha/beta hydrolase n=1 Tax=Herbiconiux daphne TaxID=2970914 RepID=A0ABT2H7M0_9MICO|nr:alpha/beta hydrolase [Herbiconiux daphne]MCS5735902.1 alpha/beta hydrolase [Herbiconiux daphne]